jgi:hypothetical protein
MQRHQWAASRLWEGVIGPSDVAWREGASVMARTTIDLARTTNAKPNEDVVRHAETVHELSLRAIELSEPARRGALYGEMLEACASCHSIVRPRTIADGH